MSLAPLLNASIAIQIHAAAALLAFVVGAVQLAGPKGTNVHRALGYVWAAAMVVVAVSSFWIHEIRQLGGFSLIHLLSIWVLVSLPMAIAAARAGRISSHRYTMGSLFFFALLLAGAFTLLPGRLMYQVVLGG